MLRVEWLWDSASSTMQLLQLELPRPKVLGASSFWTGTSIMGMEPNTFSRMILLSCICLYTATMGEPMCGYQFFIYRYLIFILTP